MHPKATFLHGFSWLLIFSLPQQAGLTSYKGFAWAFGAEADNQKVGCSILEPLTLSAAGGGVGSLFCYGHTGSGKTHTLFGSAKEPGLWLLATEQLLSRVSERPQQQPEGCDLGLIIQVREYYL